jgi:plasmid stabilization system protein ParE
MEGNSVYTVILSSKAQKELAAAWQWYEEREEGLGDRLVALVMQKLNSVVNTPALFLIKHKPYREAKVSVFPFLIVYKVYEKRKIIEAVSVFHTSRNPKRKY